MITGRKKNSNLVLENNTNSTNSSNLCEKKILINLNKKNENIFQNREDVKKIVNNLPIPKKNSENDFFIYVLKCENNKFYVGRSINIYNRIYQHSQKINSANFTKLYKPLELIEVFITEDSFEEDKTVKKYMNRFGIQNVRGGTYSEIQLSPNKIKCLQDEINHSNGICYRCKQRGHYAKVIIFFFH